MSNVPFLRGRGLPSLAVLILFWPVYFIIYFILHLFVSPKVSKGLASALGHKKGGLFDPARQRNAWIEALIYFIIAFIIFNIIAYGSAG